MAVLAYAIVTVQANLRSSISRRAPIDLILVGTGDLAYAVAPVNREQIAENGVTDCT